MCPSLQGMGSWSFRERSRPEEAVHPLPVSSACMYLIGKPVLLVLRAPAQAWQGNRYVGSLAARVAMSTGLLLEQGVRAAACRQDSGLRANTFHSGPQPHQTVFAMLAPTAATLVRDDRFAPAWHWTQWGRWALKSAVSCDCPSARGYQRSSSMQSHAASAAQVPVAMTISSMDHQVTFLI